MDGKNALQEDCMNWKIFLLLVCLTVTAQVDSKHTIQQTFAMIKPHAVELNKTDAIIEKIKNAGFAIIAIKYLTLTSRDVSQLYRQYKRKSWFYDYVHSMAGRNAVVMILEKDNAVADWDRHKKIIRHYYYPISQENNMIHGSDSIKDAQREIALFFNEL